MAITQVWETMVEHVTKDGATLESLEDMLHLAGSSRTFADAIGWADGCFVTPRVDQFKKLRALALDGPLENQSPSHPYATAAIL